jgi:toxin ParE1/3/4
MLTVATGSPKFRGLKGAIINIAQNSPRYAQGVVDRITRQTMQLAQFPRLGAVVQEYDDASIRELFEHPYRIIYRIGTNQVIILSVVHGSRLLPPGAPGSG